MFYRRNLQLKILKKVNFSETDSSILILSMSEKKIVTVPSSENTEKKS